jgi:hypothetical protein
MEPRAGQWLVLLIPLSVAAPATGEESLLTCRKIDAADERLACYDRVVDRTREALTAEAPVPTPRPSSSGSSPATALGGEDADAALRERLFGRPAGESEETLRRTYGVDAPGGITSKAAAVSRTADRRLELTLENGQVWRQAEGSFFSVRVGDSIAIESGALGAYYLRCNGKGRTVRVKRVR